MFRQHTLQLSKWDFAEKSKCNENAVCILLVRGYYDYLNSKCDTTWDWIAMALNTTSLPKKKINKNRNKCLVIITRMHMNPMKISILTVQMSFLYYFCSLSAEEVKVITEIFHCHIFNNVMLSVYSDGSSTSNRTSSYLTARVCLHTMLDL